MESASPWPLLSAGAMAPSCFLCLSKQRVFKVHMSSGNANLTELTTVWASFQEPLLLSCVPCRRGSSIRMCFPFPTGPVSYFPETAVRCSFSSCTVRARPEHGRLSECWPKGLVPSSARLEATMGTCAARGAGGSPMAPAGLGEMEVWRARGVLLPS